MIILKTPKGWTGPKEVDGLKTEGFLALAPGAVAEMRQSPAHVTLLEDWMKSYRPQELFDEAARCARRSQPLHRQPTGG